MRKMIPDILTLRKYIIIISVIWILVITGSSGWDIINQIQTTRDLAINKARENFNKDQAFRFWAASHGGVYVPVSDLVSPNPNLSHIPERDVVTPSGKKLTLMNPAFIIRQLMESYPEKYGIKGKITSLKPIRPQNAPDAWEEQALRKFEEGEHEVLDFTYIDGKPALRYMQTMIVQNRCLKCHGYQGYKVGDVRGGVGVAVLMEPFIKIRNNAIIMNILSHMVILILGFVFIILAWRRLRTALLIDMAAKKALRESEQMLLLIAENYPNSYVSIINKDNTIGFISGQEFKKTNRIARDYVGRDVEELFGELTPEVKQNYHTAFDGDESSLEVRNRGQYQLYRTIPLFDENDMVTRILSFIENITERKIREDEIKTSLKEKEILLKEVQHRVKNNLQIVSSLLTLQLDFIENTKDRDLFLNSCNRIHSMALVHGKIYRSYNLMELNIKSFIDELVTELLSCYQNEISFEIIKDVDDIFLPVSKAIPCGLILNELITNSIKHAVSDNIKGRLVIKVSADDENYTCVVEDNGPGLPRDFNPENPVQLGLQLVNALVHQLNGIIVFKSNNGTKCSVIFPRKILYQGEE